MFVRGGSSVEDWLTPASVHSLWISNKFLNDRCFTIHSRLRFSLLLVHLFLPHFFLPLNFLLIYLNTALCEQLASLAMTFCGLPSLWRMSMTMSSVKLAATRLRECLKAQETFAGVLSQLVKSYMGLLLLAIIRVLVGTDCETESIFRKTCTLVCIPYYVNWSMHTVQLYLLSSSSSQRLDMEK